jgi:hypothetical protein
MLRIYYLMGEENPDDAQKIHRKVRNEDTNITQEGQAGTPSEELKEKKAHAEIEGHKGVDGYSKYAVGGKSKEVPASALDENDNFIHRREQNQPKQKK